jgi:hypothetical protein
VEVVEVPAEVVVLATTVTDVAMRKVKLRLRMMQHSSSWSTTRARTAWIT